MRSWPRWSRELATGPRENHPTPNRLARWPSSRSSERCATLGPDHPMILAMSSLKAVALASSSLSDTTTTARSECADALRRAQSRLGPYHPTTLWLTGNLVLIFVLEGDAEGARILGERTLDRSRNHLGPNHPITLNSCAVVAFGMARNGDAEQARAFAEDTVERCRNSLGPNHPSTLGAAGSHEHLTGSPGRDRASANPQGGRPGACPGPAGPRPPDHPRSTAGTELKLEPLHRSARIGRPHPVSGASVGRTSPRNAHPGGRWQLLGRFSVSTPLQAISTPVQLT